MPNRKSRRAGYGWIACSILLVCIAQLGMKYGMDQLPGKPGIDTYKQLLEPAILLSAGSYIFLGMLCYAISVACWMLALERLPLSIAYPLLSLSYILVYIAAVVLPFFQEVLSIQRLAGILLLCTGVFFVSIPNKKQPST